jgi:hypothetical protein
MTMRAAIRWAVCATVLTFAGSAIARAQGAAGAGTTGPTSQPSRANSSSVPAAKSAVGIQSDTYKPITAKQRLAWIAESTMGPQHLAAGLVQAGFNTGLDSPREDGPHWAGFAERYGVHLTVVGTSNTMEAGLGALWGEDPRYRREPERSFGGRISSVVIQAFMTRRRDGRFRPAYARYIAVPGSNFLANTWWPDSQADSYHASLRTLYGFAGQIGNNAWDEFWPSISGHIFHRDR